MPPIPRDKSLDGALVLLRDPYGFIFTRCRRYRSSPFEARRLLRNTVSMTGPQAAELVYGPDRFAPFGGWW